MADWESRNIGGVKDNWDDEEEDNVKDAWDDEEEEAPAPKIETKKPAASTTVSKTSQPAKELTEEEKKEAQMKADLANATELFGLEKSLDEFSIDTKEEYKDFINRINARLASSIKKSFYFEFTEELFKTMSQSFTSDQVKKLSNSLKVISDLKLAEERANKPKDAKKAKVKGKIKLEANRIKGDFDEFLKDTNRIYDDDNDDDDFM